MEIMTRDFGRIEINEDNIIEFPDGIPGFLEQKEFVLLPLKEDSPFIVMQSIKEEDLAFITVEPGNLIGGYEFEINEKTEELLKIESIEEVVILNIATIKESIEEMTVNLAAPVVINIEAGLGKQIILDSEKYPVRFQVFNEKEESEKKEKVAE